MRLDKFLKVSRVIKRRTVANEACDNGHVEVNGKVARASLDVKTGDTVKIAFGERTVTLRVLDVRENVSKAEASDLYEVVEG
ncbi:MAG: RNA-binding S4 domain-containing protein [Clostridia bacterium]|nr:RNA-binding S4 domain-containing protein [Clostridia bacterium]